MKPDTENESAAAAERVEFSDRTKERPEGSGDSRPLDVEVFRAGDYGEKGRYAEADLDALAARYGADGHEAPVTLDHAQAGPAHGWVGGLRRVGDVLVARLRGLSGELREALLAGRYRKPSVELDFGGSEGALRLRAVTFLGARVPEVKGLATPLFKETVADDGATIRLDFAVADEAASDAREIPAIPPGEEGARVEEAGTDKNGVAGNGGDAREERRRYTIARLNEAVGRLRASGRWSPVWERRGLARFMEAISGADEGAEFDALEWFVEFAEATLSAVPLGEAAGRPAGGIRNFASPSGPGAAGGWGGETAGRGPSVSAASLALDERARELIRDCPELSYAEAVRRASC